MKCILKTGSIVALAAVLFTSCESKTSEKVTEVTTSQAQTTEIKKSNKPKKGEHVPNNLVCMVNDAYMGKEQIEVPHEGKMYYGCCNMCKEKIPKDENVRYATDPYSLKKISKADAYIVVIGNNNEVAYFESEVNYQLFLKEHS